MTLGVPLRVLSLQSWVAHGHVGHAAALLPLWRLGVEVSAVHTVQFSNHPGYGDAEGRATEPAQLAALVEGVARRGGLGRFDAVLSGYVGDPAAAEVILDAARRVKAGNGAALWCCDPVMGDDGRVYVQPGIAEFFRARAVAAADVLTPNATELGLLTGAEIGGRAALVAALGALRARMTGPRIVFVTSAVLDDTPAGALDAFVAGANGIARIRIPRLPIAPSGAGDLTAALFLARYLRGRDAVRAACLALASAHEIMIATVASGTRELAIVSAQDAFANPAHAFVAEPL